MPSIKFQLWITFPPSTGKAIPVTQHDSSLANQTAAWAISSGPIRPPSPHGMEPFKKSSIWPPSTKGAVMLVRTAGGWGVLSTTLLAFAGLETETLTTWTNGVALDLDVAILDGRCLCEADDACFRCGVRSWIRGECLNRNAGDRLLVDRSQTYHTL